MTVAAPVNLTPRYSVSPEMLQALKAQQRELMRNAPLNDPPAELDRDEAFIFRSRPGTHRQILHSLDMPPDRERKNGEFYYKRWLKRQGVRVVGVPKEELEKSAKLAEEKLEALQDAFGAPIFSFQRIPYHKECFYATNNEAAAKYIRTLMDAKRGEFAEVYEESGKTLLKVGDEIYPNSEMGRKAAYAYAAEQKLDAIEFIRQ